MRVNEMFRTNSRARVALLGIAALLLAAGAAVAQGARADDDVPYRSSIQVPDDDGESQEEERETGASSEAVGETDEAEDGEDAKAELLEATRYQSLARITADQARTAAAAQVSGVVTSVVLENEDGNLVYAVTVRAGTVDQEVKVDAGDARVLHVEAAEQDG